MQALGAHVLGFGSIYFVGSATALLYGWRESTVDIDIALAPEPKGLFQAIEHIKRSLGVNIELASPDQFVPPLPGWQTRSHFIARIGPIDFYHYDLYTQALAKLSRGHARDLDDVQCMVQSGEVLPSELLRLFDQVRDEVVRYPGLDAERLRTRIVQWKPHV